MSDIQMQAIPAQYSYVPAPLPAEPAVAAPVMAMQRPVAFSRYPK